MKFLLLSAGLLLFIYSYEQGAAEKKSAASKEKAQSLFNGKDLNGWYSFLKTKGKNNDSEKIFSVENGILHISGKEFGYIATEKSYSNFRLVAEFKWGIKKYPPRDADSVKRDNGICIIFL
jgi:hypothetical protein